MVRMEESLGRKAVLLGYVLPLVVLLVSIIVFLSLLKHEGLAALLSILMLVPYYLSLVFIQETGCRKNSGSGSNELNIQIILLVIN